MLHAINRATAASSDYDLWGYCRADPCNGTHRAVQWCHQGATLMTQAFDNSGRPGTYALLRKLAGAGYNLAASDLGNQSHLGNPTSQTRAINVDTLATTSVASGGNGASSSKGRLVLGISQGVITAIDAYGQNSNASKVAGFIFILPAYDLDYLYQNGNAAPLSPLRSQIETAWGITWPAALPSHAQPSTNVASFTGIPVYIAGSSDDVITNSAAIQTTMAADFTTAGCTVTNVNLGALGHTEAAISAAVDGAVAWALANVPP